MNRKVDWHGSIAVIVTPFTKDGDINEAGYREVIDFVISCGCHGVISTGSTGEFFLMSGDERKQVFEIAVDQVKGRVLLLAGTSAIRTEEVVELTRYAAELGYDGSLILPSMYVGLDDREVFEFYNRISGEAGLPIMLYNSPRAVRTFLTPKLVERLITIDNVVAVKESSYELRHISDLIRFIGGEIPVFTGLEDLMLPAMAVGAKGAVSMTVQIVGRMATDLYEAAASGDMKKAKKLHLKIVRIYDLFKVGSIYVAIKEAMNLLGRPGGYSRPPMLPFTEKQIMELRKILQDVGLFAPIK